jgi:hypothetical protein
VVAIAEISFLLFGHLEGLCKVRNGGVTFLKSIFRGFAEIWKNTAEGLHFAQKWSEALRGGGRPFSRMLSLFGRRFEWKDFPL